MSDTTLELALRRLADQLKSRSQSQAASAAAGVAAEAADAAAAEVDVHATLRQFVHGVGPLYVAKTKNPDQYVDWAEIKNKPTSFPGTGGFDPAELEIDGDQITTGTVPINRLPVAADGVADPLKLVRSDDGRLNAAPVAVVITGEALAAGDFVRMANTSGTARAWRADATLFANAAIGFVASSAGIGETAMIYSGGENVHCQLAGATVADLGLTVFLNTTPGRIGRLPPSGTGQLLQPLGTVTAIHSSTVVSVLVRYEFRFQL
ncbi:hypothetical protein EKD04_009660 [Chloroflexales bacterium ZM16-3]|nr:hypothetical protein [Chloroflexales bacterium ZM16-3]